MTPLRSVTAVVVTWNSAADIEGCLAALSAAEGEIQRQLDIIVVDNDSGDETVAAVRARFPRVRLVQAHRNLGFGAAANIGMAEATGDAVLLINPDAHLETGALGAMLTHLEGQPDLACVAPMHTADGKPAIWPGRRLPTLAAAVTDGTIVERFMPDLPALRRYYMRDGTDDEPEWLTGACLCFRRRALAETGGFDVGYEMYAEEVDLLRELGHRGWRCGVTRNAGVRHRGGASSEQDPVSRERRFFASRYRYVTKTWGWPVAALLRLLVALSGVVRLLEQFVRLLRPQARADARRELRQIAAVTLWQWTGWRR
ncbi:MAG: glycosyltransferase family 2 protein [Chloroflexi bacterium]|nr:glycosyltransferase family 2 protein [Chloroflexota bacterium]